MQGGRFEELQRLDMPAMEERILAWWQQERIFARCQESRRGNTGFAFYEGPPTANGKPGLHHIFGRTLKDIICRYQSMRGRYVERRAGWDTHGLPVEIEVEKEYQLADRPAIEAFGIERFNQACRDSVLRYKQHWDQLTRRIGYWVDLDAPYITFDNNYIESVWWLVQRLHERGLLYRDHRIQWYSPTSGTVLSAHEVSLGYREVIDPGALVKFADQEQADTFYLAWTTTPWTLPANVALAVAPDADFVKVQPQGSTELLWLAEACLPILGVAYEIRERLPGAALVGRRYQPLFPAAQTDDNDRALRIYGAGFVGSSEGTGIVHIAPAFGADDHALGRQEQLPLVNPIDLQGRFTTALPTLAGLWFKDADPKVLQELQARNRLYRVDRHRHNYPHDWRRWTPLMSYPMEGWFVRTSQLRARMMELNDTIHWHPPAIGTGRFGNWLENNVDWSLSRRRFWGTPLPIWQSDRTDHTEVIGSVAELAKKCRLPEPLNLHRPMVDELTWPDADGGTMRRIPEVLDVWFDSGAMPYAQWHYPFENQAAFQQNFPADFIAEGLDQTRGWFYTLHALSTAVMDRPAFRNVIVNGLVLDAHGEKMSKSRNNTVDPEAILQQYGADVLRWYFTANALPWENLRFREAGLTATRRKFFGTLENVYSFLASYANIDGYTGAEPDIAQTEAMDRWILSRTHSTISEAGDALERYATHAASHAIERLVDELSNWYLRRSRDRFWRKGDSAVDQDKQAAYQTLHRCLKQIAMLMAPIAPFFAEWLYLALHPEPRSSVHLCDYPTADPALVDPALERQMQLARSLVTAALQLRNRARINVRQPLSRLLLVLPPAIHATAIDDIRTLMLEELNIQSIHIQDSSSALVRYTARPNFKKLGPVLGQRMQALTTAVSQLSPAQLRDYMGQGELSLTLQQDTITLKADDLQVQVHAVQEDMQLEHTSEGIIVALDTHITPELLASGLARESVNRIQNMRKRNAFALTDRIAIEYKATDQLGAALRQHEDWICRETLAHTLQPSEQPSGEHKAHFEIEQERLELAITRERS